MPAYGYPVLSRSLRKGGSVELVAGAVAQSTVQSQLLSAEAIRKSSLDASRQILAQAAPDK